MNFQLNEEMKLLDVSIQKMPIGSKQGIPRRALSLPITLQKKKTETIVENGDGSSQVGDDINKVKSESDIGKEKN